MSFSIPALIRRSASFWQRLGADPEQLVAILEARLLLDSRRSNFLQQHHWSKKKSGAGARWFIAIFLGFFGLMMSALFFVFEQISLALFLYLTVWMVMLTLTLITDFTEVLIDGRDNHVILPRPVNGKTLMISRLIHITVYLLKITFAFAIPGLLAFPFAGGLGGLLLFVLQLGLSVAVVIFLVNAFYLLIIRLFSPARIKDLLGYVQIGFTVLVFAGYYAVPRLLDLEEIAKLSIYDFSFLGLFPSTWIASLWDTVMEGNLEIRALYYSTLALIMPPLALFLVLKVLAPRFNQQLLQLSRGGGKRAEKKEAAKQEKLSVGTYRKWWQNVLNHPVERAGFDLAWALTGRERDYKVRTFPIFGMLPAYFAYIALTGEGTLEDRWFAVLESDWYLVLIYSTFLLSFTLIQNSFFTKHPERAWLFLAFPIDHPGRLITGTIFGVLARYFFPTYLAISLFVMACWGWQTGLDLLFGLLAILLATLVTCQLQLRYLPFSRDLSDAQNGQNLGLIMLGGILATVLGFVHYGLMHVPWLLVLILPVLAFASWSALKAYRKLGWKKMLGT